MVVGHGVLRTGTGVRGWLQWAVSTRSWSARAGRMRAWYSAWADTRPGVRSGWRYRTDHKVAAMSRPYRHRSWDFPARTQGVGQVAVAGPVDLLDPGPQPGEGFGAVGGREFPPGRGRVGLVPAGVGVARGELGDQAGELGELAGERGDLLTVVGELVQRRGEGVGWHGQLHG